MQGRLTEALSTIEDKNTTIEELQETVSGMQEELDLACDQLSATQQEREGACMHGEDLRVELRKRCDKILSLENSGRLLSLFVSPTPLSLMH